MKFNPLEANWPIGLDNAKLQIRIGELAHAMRNGSTRGDYAAHYVVNERASLEIRRLYRSRGVKWHDLYRAAAAWSKALMLDARP